MIKKEYMYRPEISYYIFKVYDDQYKLVFKLKCEPSIVKEMLKDCDTIKDIASTLSRNRVQFNWLQM